MKNFTYCLFLLAMLTGLNLVAQSPEKGKISGQVLDNQNKILEFTTVTLLKAKDSTLVKGALGDANGRFEFEKVLEGRYLVAVSLMGYQKFYSPAFSVLGSSEIKMEVIQLKEASKELAEVKVVAAKPFIEQQLDKTVVNVENSIVSAGSTALEVLEKSPGVTVDSDGKISLKGKQAVLVMIDGKPTYMSATDLANFLRNMQANQMEKIEIMTNPPAKYDAAGNAGIINIRLKKNQNMGLNGSVNAGAGYGRFEKASAGINLNYRQGKMNVFGSYNVRHNRSFQDLTIIRALKQKDSTAYFTGVTNNERTNDSHAVRAGIDYFLDKKSTIGALFTANATTWKNTGPDILQALDRNQQLVNTTQTLSDVVNSYGSLSGNLNFKHTFDSTGKELTADLDIAQYNNPSDQFYGITVFDKNKKATNTSSLYGNSKSIIDIYSGKVDYVHPLKNKARFEAGWKSSYVRSDNDVVYSLSKSGEALPNMSNHFVYSENINAIYANYSKEFKKTSVQIGLRLEHNHGDGNQMTTNTRFVRDTVNVFPTLYIRQTLSKDHTLGFSFAQRIDRPSYEDLNPFIFFLNNYTYQKGNPTLRPQYTNSIEVSHTYKGSVITTFNISRTNGAMSEAIGQIPELQATFVTRSNIGTFDNLGLSVSFPLPLAKWLNSNNYLGVTHNHFYGFIPVVNETIDRSGTNVTFNSQNNIVLSKGYSLEVSGFYMSGFVEGQITGKPMGQVSMGIQKKMMGGNATLRLNVNDIFWTNYFRGDFNTPTVTTQVNSINESRVVRASFTYRFGSNKIAAARQRQTGLESEKGRVKNQ